MKCLYDFGIELTSNPLIQFLSRSFVCSSPTVNTIAGDCVEGIGDGENPGTDINFIAFQSQWISRAVPFFVVLRNHTRRAFEECDAPQDLLTVQRVFAHSDP